MNKAQQMLAKAGFPDTAAGRAAFHKQYPTPDSFFQVHGGQDTEMYGAGSTIHIDPSKRGTFTAAATKHDKSVQEFASQVLANKENYSPAMVKKANFARNAASWKHEDGGPVMYADGGKLPQGILRSRLESHMSPNEAQSYINSYAQGGTVDVYQLMGMPTPRMYGPGSTVHPTLTLSTENNLNPSFKPEYSNNPYYNKTYSVNDRTTLAGTLPLINNKLNLTGSYGTNDTYTGGLELNVGDILSGGGNGPSRKYDNPDIAHKGRSFLDTYGHLRAGVTNKGNKVLPYFGGDFTVAHQMGRVKGPNGLRQPKGTAYASAELNQVEDPLNAMYENDNYMRANLGGSYNFGKGLGIYGEAGYDFMRNAPRGEIGLKKTFADGGPITDYSPSSNFGAVLSKNNSYMHGFGYGGRVGMYGFGSTIKDLGYGMADSSLGTIGSLTGIKSMQDIVDEDQYSNDKFDNVANFAGKVGGTAIKFIPGVGQVVGAVGAGAGALANTAFKIDERNYDPSQHTSNWDKVGNFVEGAGNIASSFVNPMGAADTLSKGAQTAMNVGKIAGLGATGINAARDIDKSRGGTYDPTNLLNLGMGVAKSGFFGGNTNTSNNFTNTKGAVDYTPTMDTPLYAAMGGAVNAPNMMKYDAGSNVNSTSMSPKDQYNLFLKAKPVTKYFSPAMPFHPKDGSMDPRGTVVGSIDPQTGEPIEINIEKNEARWKLPNNTDFITTKKDTDKILAFDKNGDNIAKVTAMLNTTFDKNKKAAKQSMMMQGGMVGQYGYGGGVRMFAAGGPPGPLEPSENTGYVYNFGEEDPSAAVNMYDFDASTPFNIMNVGMYGTQPSRYYSASNPNIYPSPNAYGNPAAAPVYNAGNVTGYTPTNFRMPSVGAPNKNAFITSQVYGSNPNTSYGPWNAQNAPTSPVGPAAPAQDLQDSQGPFIGVQGEPYSNRGYYDFPDTPDTPSAPPINNPYIPVVTDAETTTPTPSWFSRNKQDLGTAAGKAIMYGPALYNIARSLSKPFQMNAADYQIKGDIDPYEEEYRPDYRTYNAAVANLNRMPGSGNLAARTNLFNAMQQQQDDARYKIGLGNAQRKMTRDQARLGREEKNLNTAMQIAQFNQQNKEVPGNMLAQGLGDASQAYQFERFNKLSANAMGNIMQHFTILPDGTMVPKTSYNPAAYNSIYNAGNTPTTFDPSLVSPNRYANQGVGIRTNNRFIPNFKTIDPNQFNLFDK